MKITKTTTKTYDVYDCAEWQMTVGNTIVNRERVGMKSRGFDKCFICNRNLNADEYPYLALIRNHANAFICEDCAKKVKNENDEQNTNT